MRVSTKKTLLEKQPPINECQNMAGTNETLGELVKKKSKKVSNIADEKIDVARMDLIFLIIFPFLFILFNCVYWFSFLYVFQE